MAFAHYTVADTIKINFYMKDVFVRVSTALKYYNQKQPGEERVRFILHV